MSARPPGPEPTCRPQAMAHQERTFIAIKPDGVQRGLVGEIIKRFEQKGFRLVAMKFLQVTRHPSPPPAPRCPAAGAPLAHPPPLTAPPPKALAPRRSWRPSLAPGPRARAPSQG